MVSPKKKFGGPGFPPTKEYCPNAHYLRAFGHVEEKCNCGSNCPESMNPKPSSMNPKP